MNFYQFKEYLKYKRSAVGRHGVHSPFVYDFVENCLRKKAPDKVVSLVNQRVDFKIEKRNILLVASVLHYFNVKTFAIGAQQTNQANLFHKLLSDAGLKENEPHQDCLLIIDKNPKASLPGYRHSYRAGFIMVMGIHQSPLHKTCWEDLYQQKEVNLSIDLFNIGLLFFNKEFKEKQHFVLKYPA